MFDTKAKEQRYVDILVSFSNAIVYILCCGVCDFYRVDNLTLYTQGECLYHTFYTVHGAKGDLKNKKWTLIQKLNINLVL